MNYSCYIDQLKNKNKNKSCHPNIVPEQVESTYGGKT